jgi:beta-xylosidase
MKKIIIIITCFIGLSGAFAQQREIFHNPVIEADVPDPSMIRVGNYYYLVSTTMHLTFQSGYCKQKKEFLKTRNG